MEDDQRGDGDAADDPRLQEGAHQIHHHHLSQAWSSVGDQGAEVYCRSASAKYNNVDPWPHRRLLKKILYQNEQSPWTCSPIAMTVK